MCKKLRVRSHTIHQEFNSLLFRKNKVKNWHNLHFSDVYCRMRVMLGKEIVADIKSLSDVKENEGKFSLKCKGS